MEATVELIIRGDAFEFLELGGSRVRLDIG